MRRLRFQLREMMALLGSVRSRTRVKRLALVLVLPVRAAGGKAVVMRCPVHCAVGALITVLVSTLPAAAETTALTTTGQRRHRWRRPQQATATVRRSAATAVLAFDLGRLRPGAWGRQRPLPTCSSETLSQAPPPGSASTPRAATPTGESNLSRRSCRRPLHRLHSAASDWCPGMPTATLTCSFGTSSLAPPPGSASTRRRRREPHQLQPAISANGRYIAFASCAVRSGGWRRGPHRSGTSSFETS